MSQQMATPSVTENSEYSVTDGNRQRISPHERLNQKRKEQRARSHSQDNLSRYTVISRGYYKERILKGSRR